MRRFKSLFLFVAAVTAACAFSILPPAAEAQEHGPHALRAGPRVSAASFSSRQLQENLTFHTSGQFVAHLLTNPPSHPAGGSPLRGRAIALGHHAAGTTQIAFRLGTLKPARYAVVITPTPQTGTRNSSLAATWVYFTVQKGGSIRKIRLITP